MKTSLIKVRFIEVIFLLFFSLLTCASYSQTASKPSDGFPNVLPATPNSSSLGLYGQLPLNQFTGNATVSIPLFNLKSHDLQLPISLSYSSDGIKVDQYESNVGMGWALNAGGVITRQVFDYEDTSAGRLQMPNATSSSNEMTTFLYETSSSPQVDTQPDIYTYNFNGMSGKFYIDDNMKPVEIEPTGIKITLNSSFFDSSDPNGSPKFIITDLNGIQYFFGGINAVETSFNRKIAVGYQEPPSVEVENSWYLTKIFNPVTSDEINFTYDSSLATYFSGNEQNLDYTYSSSFLIGGKLTNYKYRTTSRESLLREITSKVGKMVFTNVKRFPEDNFPFSKLSEINCYDLNSNLIKKVQFDYTNYDATTFTNEYTISESYLKKRYFLTKITESNGTASPATHQFEYYFPEQLPTRFSFAQDTYGLFNGKSNTNLISDENIIPYSVSKNILPEGKLANRRPDKNFGYYGLLKKIIYPTKGSTTIEYEPHVKGTVSVPIDMVSTPFNLDVSTNSEQLFNNSNTSIIHSSIVQTVKINGFVQDNCTGELNNPFPLLSQVQIYEVATNSPVEFWVYNTDTPISIGNTYQITGITNPNDIVFHLEANKDYLVKISLLRPCMFSNVYFNYVKDPVSYQEIEKQIGGFRISKVNKHNLYSTLPEIERYFYGPMECLNCQSGFYINQAPVSYIRKTQIINPCENISSKTNYSFGSSNLSRLYSSQNVQFGYEYVTKSYGDNFENGGEEFRYNIVQDEYPILLQNEEDKTTPFSNGFGSGQQLTHRLFNSALKTTKIIQNTYEQYVAKNQSVTGYNAYLSYYNYAGVDGNCIQAIGYDNFSLSKYYLRSQWHYLKETKTIDFDSNGLNPITTKTINEYFNTTHLQLSVKKAFNSVGETLSTRYYYPSDLLSEPFMLSLSDSNRILPPVQTENYNGTTQLSVHKSTYAKDASTANLVLPKSVYSAKFPNNIPFTTNVGNLEKKLTYDFYDSSGNLTQYTPEGGAPVSIVWGYNKTQPIAKIENATNAQLVSALGVTNFSAITEAQLSSLNNLRTNAAFSQSMITTYTYQPLVGVSSITDPKGDTVYYTYDGLGRLQYVKDTQGKLLTDYQYHYKN